MRMEIKSIAIDLDNDVLEINGKEFLKMPIVVTLPGFGGWPHAKLFNKDKATGDPKECCELLITFTEANNKL